MTVERSAPREGRRSIVALVLSTGAQGIVSLTNFALVVVAAHVLSAAQVGFYVLALSALNFLSGFIQTVNVESLAMEHRDPAVLAATRTRASVLVRALLLGSAAALVLGLPVALVLPDFAGLVIVSALTLPFLAVLDSHRFWLLAVRRAPTAVAWDLPWVLGTAVAITVALLTGALRSPESLLLCYAVPLALAGACRLVTGHLRSARIRPEGTELRHHRNLSVEYLINQAVNQAVLFGVGFRLGAPDAAAFRTSQNLFGPLNILLAASRAALFPQLSTTLRSNGQVKAWLRVTAPFAVLTALVLGAVLVLGSVFGGLVLGVTAEHAVPLLPALAVQYVALIVQTGALIALRATGDSGSSATARTLQAVVAALCAAVGLGSRDLHVLVWALAGGAVVSGVIWSAFAVRSLRRFVPTKEAISR